MEQLDLTQEWDKVFPKSGKVDHKKVTFHNRYGITLAADMYTPKGAEGKLPAIAVSGPFGAVKEQSSGLYAQKMAELGFLTIAFDPSYTGESGGEPRYVASPDINTEDFCAAVDFLSVQENVDPERIGIIGICGWGGMAINAAAIDTRIKATAAMTMYDMTRVNAKGYFDSEDSDYKTPRGYSPLVKAMQGEVIHISATSENHINAMDMNSDYGDGANPVILKSEFILSLCEQLIGGASLGAKQKSIIDRCTASVYRHYQQGNYQGVPPTLQDFREELLKQDEPEAKEIALAIELFTDGSLNTFAKHTNVDTHSRLICYDILDLGKQLQPIGMLVVLDSILNRITQNRAKGRNTFIFIDEIYLLFQHEYSANFLFTLWKRVRKYGAYCTGITQNVDDLLQSHTARTMLANSEFIIMLNQASTDRIELAKLLNISDLQMSYITNVGAGQGLLKVGSSLVPFVNKFPRNMVAGAIRHFWRRRRDCQCGIVAGRKYRRSALLELVRIRGACGMVCLLCILVCQ